MQQLIFQVAMSIGFVLSFGLTAKTPFLALLYTVTAISAVYFLKGSV